MGSLLRYKEALGAWNFYLSIDQGMVSNKIERILGLGESRIGSIRKELEFGRGLTPSDRRKLWEFVLGMFIRTLPWRRNLEKMGPAVKEIYIEHAVAEPDSILRGHLPRRERRNLSKERKRQFVLAFVADMQPQLDALARF